MKENNFMEEIEEELERQFPKGECKERGNALVLFAMFSIGLKKRIKEMEKYCRSKNFSGGIVALKEIFGDLE